AVGEPGRGGGIDGVDGDAVALQFQGGGDRESGDPGLGGGVVALAGIAEQAAGRTGVDQPRVHRLARLGAGPPVGRGVLRDGEGAAQVHADDVVPVGGRHVHQHPVAEDAGVVDHDVEAAELAQRGPHQPSGRLVVGDVVGVRDRVPAGRPDLLGDGLGGAGVGAGAVPGAPEVVDDDGGSLAGQLDGVGPAYSAGGAGDD